MSVCKTLQLIMMLDNEAQTLVSKSFISYIDVNVWLVPI